MGKHYYPHFDPQSTLIKNPSLSICLVQKIGALQSTITQMTILLISGLWAITMSYRILSSERRLLRQQTLRTSRGISLSRSRLASIRYGRLFLTPTLPSRVATRHSTHHAFLVMIITQDLMILDPTHIQRSTPYKCLPDCFLLPTLQQVNTSTPRPTQTRTCKL